MAMQFAIALMQTYCMSFSQSLKSLFICRRLVQGLQCSWKQIGSAWKFAIIGAVILIAGLSIRFSVPRLWFVFVPINLAGLLLGVGGALAGLRPHIGKISLKGVRIALRWAWRGAASGLFLIEVGAWSH